MWIISVIYNNEYNFLGAKFQASSTFWIMVTIVTILPKLAKQPIEKAVIIYNYHNLFNIILFDTDGRLAMIELNKKYKYLWSLIPTGMLRLLLAYQYKVFE